MKLDRIVQISVLVFALSVHFVQAQTSSSVEDLSSVTSIGIKNGLGFNIDTKWEWEFQMAAAAGATEARFQPSWPAVENMNGDFAMPASAQTALDWCAKYGINPLLVAAYGAPYQSLGKFTVAVACPVGATSIKLNQSTDAVVALSCHVKGQGNLQIVPNGKWGYYGGLITAVDNSTNTISLAAATNIPLTQGQPLVINKLRYPSCATANPTDPSIVAYARYATFMADQIAARKLTGRVEIWNEPGWAHDPWDHRGQFYDKPPQGITTASPNFGLAENLAQSKLPPGARFNWGGTNKSGGRSLLNTGFMSPPLTAEEVANSFSCEALHPYGNSPEDHMWEPTALAAANVHDIWRTTLPGESSGSNMKYARWLSLQNPTFNYKLTISETGTVTADNTAKARFIMRQYLGFLALGVERITFYCFAAPDAATTETFGFVDVKTKAPMQAYTAIKGLVVDDMAEMPIAPVSQDPKNLPSVSSYTGTYPLTTMYILGRHTSADTKNTINFVAWQRSCSPPGPVTDLVIKSVNSQVKLHWSRNTFATTSTLSRSDSADGPFTPIAPDTLRTDYVDKSVSPGKTYFYIVLSNSLGGVSGNSNEVSASPVAAGDGKFNNDVKGTSDAQVSWLKLPSPSPAKVTVHLPAGYTAIKAWNLVSRAVVPIEGAADQVSYNVADDPISVQIIPRN